MSSKRFRFNVDHLFGVVLMVLIGISSAWAQTEQELRRLSLAEWMQVEVNTVERRDRTLGRTAAAVFVITAEDTKIRKSKTAATVDRRF